jgi:hypothetical protein
VTDHNDDADSIRWPALSQVVLRRTQSESLPPGPARAPWAGPSDRSASAAAAVAASEGSGWLRQRLVVVAGLQLAPHWQAVTVTVAAYYDFQVAPPPWPATGHRDFFSAGRSKHAQSLSGPCLLH